MEDTKKLGLKYNRKIAVAVLIIIAIFSIWFSGSRGLENARNDIIDIYNNGVDNDGVGIKKDLSVRISAADKLATLAEKYTIDVSSLKNIIDEIENAGNLSEVAEYNSELDVAVYEVYNAINNSDAGEADMKSARSLYNEISSRGNMIKNDGYNTAALEFNQNTLKRFPANIIAKLGGIDELEIFR